MSEAASLNIALLPDYEVQRAAIATSGAVSDGTGTEFTLAPDGPIPHITLYQTAFPSGRLPEVYDAVADVALRTKAFRVSLREVEVYKWTFLFWHCELSDELASLHQRIVGATNRLRDGLVLPMLVSARAFLEEGEQSDVEHYGAVWIGPNFLPHITLSRIKDVNDVATGLAAAQA